MLATDDLQEAVSRRPRRRGARAAMLTLAIVGAAAVPSAVATTVASAAGPGEYSAPEWLPLRNAATVGCVMSNCPGPYHDYWAIDLLDPENSVGDPVFAAGAGQATVLTTSPTGNCGGQGTPSNILQVDHGGGVTTRYIHLDSFSVSNGAWVDQNTQIGVMGTTGWTDPCPLVHLHYEKRVGGARVDPGPLKACDGGTVRSYPAAIGASSWNDIAEYQQTVSSTGTGCETPPTPKPTCTGVDARVTHGGSAAIKLTCSGDAITYSAPSSPAHGTVSAFDAAAGTVTYSPAAGYTGPDSFTFAASNASGESDRATVSITVLPPKPSCAPVSAVVLTGVPTAIQLSCSGQTMTYAAPSATAHGSITALDASTGALTYIPAAGYNGPDSFQYSSSNAGGPSEAATVTLTISSPPVIARLRSQSQCVTSARLQATPTAGKGGLAFTYALDQAATVEYVIYRRDGSPARRSCPRRAAGHTQDTFTKQGGLAGIGIAGDNAAVLGGAKSARVTRRRPALHRSVGAGRQRVRLASIPGRRALTPGTYVLLVTATNAAGQRSAVAHAKFFVLAKRAPRASRRMMTRRPA